METFVDPFNPDDSAATKVNVSVLSSVPFDDFEDSIVRTISVIVVSSPMTIIYISILPPTTGPNTAAIKRWATPGSELLDMPLQHTYSVITDVNTDIKFYVPSFKVACSNPTSPAEVMNSLADPLFLKSDLTKGYFPSYSLMIGVFPPSSTPLIANMSTVVTVSTTPETTADPTLVGLGKNVVRPDTVIAPATMLVVTYAD